MIFISSTEVMPPLIIISSFGKSFFNYKHNHILKVEYLRFCLGVNLPNIAFLA